MLRLKNTPKRDEDFTVLPDAEPLTLIQVASDNLPYACQCPLCGGIFDIPKGILYEIEDNTEDIDSDVDFEGANAAPDGGFFDEGNSAESATKITTTSESESSAPAEEGE